MNKSPNWWSKRSPTSAIFLYALLHELSSNLYFGVKSSCLTEFGERGMPMSTTSRRWIPDLEKFQVPKTAADSTFEPRFALVPSWSSSWSKNKVCSTLLKPQLLFKVQLHASTVSDWSTQVKVASRQSLNPSFRPIEVFSCPPLNTNPSWLLL